MDKTTIIITQREGAYFFQNNGKDFAKFTTKSQGFQNLSSLFYMSKIDFENMRILFTDIANNESIPSGLIEEQQKSFEVLHRIIEYFERKSIGVFPKIMWCNCKKHGYILLTKPTGYLIEKTEVDAGILLMLHLDGEKSTDFYSKGDGIIVLHNLLRKQKITSGDFDRISNEIEEQKLLPVIQPEQKKCTN